MLRRIFVALTAASLALGGALGAARPIKAAPAAQSGALPAAACTLSGTTRTCELWAKTGTLSLPGNPALPIWGFGESAGAPARLPGPTISAEEGETLVVTVHNGLASSLSLAVPAMEALPDTMGAAAGGDVIYTFADVAAGTYLYEAGPTAGGDRQAAMGLYGGLVVRAADPATAYGSAATAFDGEALLIYSEVDPAFNAAPATFQLQRFRPKFGLINGKVYPNTAAIGGVAGKTLLLRQINAGIEHHTIGLLGLRQQIIAEDGAPRAYPYTTVAETLAPGKSLDTLVRVPAAAAAGTRYPLYDTAMPQRNSTLQGGMLAFVEVLAVDLTPPAVSALAVTPAATSAADVALSATISDAGLGDNTVAAAEYSLDSAAAAGSGTPMALGAAGVSSSASATIAVAGLADGTHTAYVRGLDSAGNWSAPASVTFLVDTTGPATDAVAVSGAALTASASDALSVVAGAEYFVGVDPGAGNGTAMAAADGAFDGTSEGLSATLGALAPGSYTVGVRARDALGTWGAAASLSFTVVDGVAPVVSGLALNTTSGALTALAADASSTVAGAEYSLDGAAAVAMAAADGAFDSASEGLVATLNLAPLAPGSHTVAVRAQDSAGNWSSPVSIGFTVASAALFSDGFEGGTMAAWTSVGGTAARLSVTAGAAMNGTTRGLAASIASGTSGYVVSTLATTQPTYRARFFVNPTGVAMNTTWRRVFSAYNSTGSTNEVYRIEMRRQTNGTYQVRAVVTRQGGTSTTSAVNISGATRVETAWQTGSATTFTLKAGATTVTLNNLNTSVRAGVRSVRMGPQGSLTGVSGTMAFDEFVATSGAAIP